MGGETEKWGERPLVDVGEEEGEGEESAERENRDEVRGRPKSRVADNGDEA